MSIYTVPERAIDMMVQDCAGEINILGYLVPSINAPLPMMDMVRDKLLSSGAPFAAMYWDTPEGRVFVLMSKDDGQDVSDVAKAYGGDGTKHTAMFKTPPQRELAGEFIPLKLELPPDGELVIVLQKGIGGDDAPTFARQATHISDGRFDVDDVVAWTWMPEMPGAGGV